MPNISYISDSPENIKDYHVLTFAETGFSVLSGLGEEYEIERRLIEQFSDAVNLRDESGSLHPNAPLSAVPRKYIRDLRDAGALTEHIKEFLVENNNTIKANRLLFDFRAGVDDFVLAACEQALREGMVANVDEIIVIDAN